MKPMLRSWQWSLGIFFGSFFTPLFQLLRCISSIYSYPLFVISCVPNADSLFPDWRRSSHLSDVTLGFSFRGGNRSEHLSYVRYTIANQPGAVKRKIDASTWNCKRGSCPFGDDSIVDLYGKRRSSPQEQTCCVDVRYQGMELPGQIYRDAHPILPPVLFSVR